MTAHELTYERLTCPLRVEVGGIDEIPASLAIRVIYLSGFLFRRSPTPFLSKGHSAQGKLGHAQAAIPKKQVVQCHRCCPFWKSNSYVPENRKKSPALRIG